MPRSSSDISVAIVIRSVGERTTACCRAIVEREFPGKPVIVIDERPFSVAVRRSFEVGIDLDRKWTLCLDADVLVEPGSLTKLCHYCDNVSDNTIFEAQGLVLDSLFGLRRPAGNHLYRTRLLPQALHCIPQPNTSLRPESHTISNMARLGYPWLQLDQIVGLHDYEQYYKDVYRKVYLQARKFRQIRNFLMEKWGRSVGVHDDYRVALLAWRDSERCADDVYADSVADGFEQFSEVLERAGLLEKQPLEVADCHPDEIAGLIKRHVASEADKLVEKAITPAFNTPLGGAQTFASVIWVLRRLQSYIRWRRVLWKA